MSATIVRWRNLTSPTRPVYGLEAVGLDGVTPPLASVEAIAAHNIREIRKVFPSGPWYLADIRSEARLPLK